MDAAKRLVLPLLWLASMVIGTILLCLAHHQHGRRATVLYVIASILVYISGGFPFGEWLRQGKSPILLLALVLLASPAQAEMLLTTVAGAFENIDSDRIEPKFQLAVDGCNRCFTKSVALADGATSWTAGLDGLNAFLATPLSELFAWNIIHPATQSHSVAAEIEFLIAGLWEPATWTYPSLGDMHYYATSTPSVDAFQTISRVELSLSNLVIEPIEYGGGDFFYRHSVDFQMRLFAAAPEPSLWALLCPLLLGCVHRRRSAIE